jgi:hypothetical protein
LRTILVTAANSPFFPLLQDWVLSIRDHEESRNVDLGVLDVGLTDEEREWVKGRVSHLVKPGWDLDLGKQEGASEHVKALTVRPFLPEHFPGYDIYIWLDGDTWVQSWFAVDLLIRAAERGSLGVVPEIDRAYLARDTDLKVERVLGIPYRISSYNFRRYRAAFGIEAARAMVDRPVINAGVFSLSVDAPHWGAWRTHYQSALHRTSRSGMDQVALTYIVYHLGHPVELLPSLCNWMAHLAVPWYDRERRRFVEPHLPHNELGILHLAVHTKSEPADLQTTDGERTRMWLRYPRGGETS